MSSAIGLNSSNYDSGRQGQIPNGNGHNQSSIRRKRKSPATSTYREQEASTMNEDEKKLQVAIDLFNKKKKDIPEKQRRVDKSSEAGEDEKNLKAKVICLEAEVEAQKALRLSKKCFKHQEYQKAIDESDKGLKANGPDSDINRTLQKYNDKAKGGKTLVEYISETLRNSEKDSMNGLCELLKDENVLTKYEEAKRLYQEGLNTLKLAKLAAEVINNNDYRMKILEQISKHANNYFKVLLCQRKYLELPQAYNVANDNLKEALFLDINNVDKMRILEQISKYSNNFAQVLHLLRNNQISEEQCKIAILNLKEALKLAKDPEDKMRIFENISKYYNNFALEQYLQQKYQDSEIHNQEAIDNLKEALNFAEKPEDKNRILENILVLTNNYAIASEKVLKSTENNDDRMRIYESIAKLAEDSTKALHLQNKYLESEPQLQAAIENSKEALKLAQDPADKMRIFENIAEYNNKYGFVLFAAGKIQDSEFLLQKAIENSKEALKLAKDPADKMRILENISSYANNYGYIEFFHEKYPKSKEKYKLSRDKLLEIFRLITPTSDAEKENFDLDKVELNADQMKILKKLASCYQNIGKAQNLNGENIESIGNYKRANIIFNKLLKLTNDNADKIRIFENILDNYKMLGDGYYFYYDIEQIISKENRTRLIKIYDIAINKAEEFLPTIVEDANKISILKTISLYKKMIAQVLLKQKKFQESNEKYKEYIEQLEKSGKLEIKLAKEEKNEDITEIQSKKIKDECDKIAQDFCKAKQNSIGVEWSNIANSKRPNGVSNRKRGRRARVIC